MKFIRYSFITLLALIFVGFAAYLIASTGLKSQSGYAELTLPERSLSKTKISINVGPTGLKSVQWLVRLIVKHSDEPLQLEEQLLLSVLEDIEAVQLRVYETGGNTSVFDHAIKVSVKHLTAHQWEPIVSIKDKHERLVVLHREEAGKTAGMVIMVSATDNSVFANFIGELDPDKIITLAKSLN